MPECIIKSGTDTVAKLNATEYFRASSARDKMDCKTQHCMVTVGALTEGIIRDGDNIYFLNNEGQIELYDRIARLEVNKASVESAEAPATVGICLRTLSKKDLEPLFQ